MKVALGCGSRYYGESWDHVDAGNYPHVKNYDLFKLPYGDESVDLIYTSHLIAYFTPDEFMRLLREWHRVLKKDGVLRIATPDFHMMSRMYQDGRVELSQILGPLYGQMLMGNSLIYHKTVWDYAKLWLVLDGEFFKNIRLYDWRQTEHADVDDHSQAYLPHMDKENGILISLNVEAAK